MVAAGTSIDVTVTGTFHEGWFSLPSWGSDLRDAVARQLANFNPPLIVESFSLQSDDTILTETWSYRAVLRVKTTVNHARVEDVLAIVEGAFWQATDTRPIVTEGINSQADPRQPKVFGELSTIAIIIVGALVLIVWAKP